MNNNRKFNDVLDECLRRLLSNNETIEQVLKSYPEFSARLKPLLETALMTRKTASIQPRPEFKARARQQLQSVLREKTRKPAHSVFSWNRQPQWATAIAIFLAVSLAGSGTIVAARGSMPDSPLYGVKQATEKIQLAVTFSGLDKAELNAQLADKRVNEIVYLADNGRPDKIAQVAESLNTNLAGITSNAAAPESSDTAVPATEPGLMLSPTETPPPMDASGGGALTGETGAGQPPDLAQTPPFSTGTVTPPPALSLNITTSKPANTNMPPRVQSMEGTHVNNPGSTANLTNRNVTSNWTKPDSKTYPVFQSPLPITSANNSARWPVTVNNTAASIWSGHGNDAEQSGKPQNDKNVRSGADGNGNKSDYNDNDRRAKLKITVENQAAANIARLQETLKTAPESAKPALRKTLEQSEREYEKALKGLK